MPIAMNGSSNDTAESLRAKIALAPANRPHVGQRKEEQARQSGVACLLMVLRHILPLLNGNDLIDLMLNDEFQKANPVLMEILDGGTETSTGGETWKELLNCGTSPLSELTFESLIDNGQMQDTIWAAPFASLFMPVYRFEKADFEATPAESLVRWDGCTPPSLREAIAQHIAARTVANKKELRLPITPTLIRVAYTHANEEIKFARDMRRFEIDLACPRPGWNDVQNIDNCLMPPKTYEYRLVAEVELRDRLAGADAVCLHYRNGMPLNPPVWREPWMSYTGVQPGARRYLFYMQVEPGWPFDESEEEFRLHDCQPSRQEEEDLWNNVSRVLQPEIAEADEAWTNELDLEEQRQLVEDPPL
jgi:hypothetical protein